VTCRFLVFLGETIRLDDFTRLDIFFDLEEEIEYATAFGPGIRGGVGGLGGIDAVNNAETDFETGVRGLGVLVEYPTREFKEFKSLDKSSILIGSICCLGLNKYLFRIPIIL
jgi:hypothetical protein